MLTTMSPRRFRFTHPDDVAQYGGEWTTYDEAKLITLPTQELMAIEKALDVPLLVQITRLKIQSIDALRNAMWIARKMDGKDDDLSTFWPIVLLAEWEKIDPEGPADADPPAQAGPTSGTSEPTA